MQHHLPGSWYLPWGVPLQKMLMTIPQHHPQAAAIYHADGSAAAAPTQMPTSPNYPLGTAGPQSQVISHTQALVQQPPPPSPQGQQSLANAAGHHLSGHRSGPYHAAAASHMHHHSLHHHNQHPQQLHSHAAAAAMFTPISLRSFLGHPSHSISHPLPQAHPPTNSPLGSASTPQMSTMSLNVGVIPMANGGGGGRHAVAGGGNGLACNGPMGGGGLMTTGQTALASLGGMNNHNSAASVVSNSLLMPMKKTIVISGCGIDKDKPKLSSVSEKRKSDEGEQLKDLKKAKLETKALKAKRPGFTDERYHETSYYIENGLRKVYPYYFTFTTFTKGRWVGEKILDVFAREFRAHPAEEYERCIDAGKLTVNYEKVATDYRLKHNDLLANIVHRHEVPVTSQPITIVHMDDDIVVVNKPASIPVHPCGRYRHNTVVFILAKEYNLKNLRTIHRLDRLTSGLLLFGRSPKKARQMEHQIRNRQVQKEYVCRVEGEFPDGIIECKEPIEVVSYKIGVCKVSSTGKDCTTTFQKIGFNGYSSVVLCKPLTGRMHQIRVHLQYLGYPVINDPLYNHEVFGPSKGKGGDIGGKTDEQLVKDLINIHNAENWLGIDGDSDLSLFKPLNSDDAIVRPLSKVDRGNTLSDDDSENISRETSPCLESPQPGSLHGNDSPPSPQSLTTSTAATTTTGNINARFSPEGTSSVGATAAAEAAPKSPVLHYQQHHFNNSLANHLNKGNKSKVTVSTQTGHESPDMAFNAEKMTVDKHCYECKVRYRDPKPQDLVMYLHAWKYKGIGWEYNTELPDWAQMEWMDGGGGGEERTSIVTESLSSPLTPSIAPILTDSATTMD